MRYFVKGVWWTHLKRRAKHIHLCFWCLESCLSCYKWESGSECSSMSRFYELDLLGLHGMGPGITWNWTWEIFMKLDPVKN
jgi:hypothetical protein